RGGNSRCVVVRQPPRPDQALPEKVVECLGRGRERRLRIGLMGEIEVDAVDAEPLEACVDLAPDPVGRETVVVRVAARRMEHLRRDPQLVGAPLVTPAPDPLLAAAAAVGVAGVEPADPAGPGGVHDRESGLLVRALAEERRRRPDPAEVPAAERESSQLSGAWSHRDAASRSIARVDGGYGPVAVARSMAWYIRTAGLAAGPED